MLAIVLFALLGSASAGTPASCPNAQLSCRNTTVVQDLCCFNSPGGQILQTQFWDTNPSTGPSNSWTLHGLWPDNCDGTYVSNCDSSRDYTGISSILTSFGKTDVLNYMETFWKNNPNDGTDEELWEHEWATHGTCLNTFDPSCYTGYQTAEEAADFFQAAVGLFQTLPSYTWLANAGIVPSTSATYTSAAIEAALSAGHGHPVTIRCSSGALNEVWYSFDVMGSIQTGTFVAADPVGQSSNCPATGVKYLPKSGTPVPTSSTPTSTRVPPTSTSVPPSSTTNPPTTSTEPPTTTTESSTPISSSTSSPAPTGSGGVLSGQGYLNVVYNSAQDGCLISRGTWYTSGTCATFTATPSGSGFTLKSSKGACAISGGQFTCSSSVSAATVFTAVGSQLAYEGSTAFYATAAAQGQTQQSVLTTSNAVSFTISWQALGGA